MHVEALEVKVQANWALLEGLGEMCWCVRWKGVT